MWYRYGHGSTRAVADLAGQIIQQYSYDAYGNAHGFNAKDALTNLLYSGEQFNAVSGLQYLRARWYSPQSGRFNRLDPYAGNQQSPSFHKYAYVHMNPIMGIDPSGLSFGNYTLFGITMAQYGSMMLRIGAYAGGLGFAAGFIDSILGGHSVGLSALNGLKVGLVCLSLTPVLVGLGIAAASSTGVSAFLFGLTAFSATLGIGSAIESIIEGNYAQAAFRLFLTIFCVANSALTGRFFTGSSGGSGNFVGMQGASIREILHRVPSNATREVFIKGRHLKEGVKFEWTNSAGNKCQLRIHEPDANPNLPPTANARNNWIFSYSENGVYMDNMGVPNPNRFANETHIPMQTPTLFELGSGLIKSSKR